MEEEALARLRAALESLTNPAPGGAGAALDRVESAARDLGDGVHPELKHFLERRSYVKAREWLKARNA